MGADADKAWKLALHCERKINALEKELKATRKELIELHTKQDKHLTELHNAQDKRFTELHNKQEKAWVTAHNDLDKRMCKAVNDLNANIEKVVAWVKQSFSKKGIFG